MSRLLTIFCCAFPMLSFLDRSRRKRRSREKDRKLFAKSIIFLAVRVKTDTALYAKPEPALSYRALGMF
jgi:hypothetical protein